MSLHPGKQVRQYVIGDLLAKGGMGVVWHAWDEMQQETVAIKAVANDLIFDPAFKMRIQDEARWHQRLEHPNIVPVTDVFEAENEICIVMKLIGGQSLSSMLDSRLHRSLDLDEAISLVTGILQALDYAHMCGVVHRDVKPSNVLVDQNNHVLLIDFGIALAAGEERRTRTGQIIGTPEYMSPEQITDPKHIDHRSDVYSVGCVLYEALTGQPPFVKGREGVGDTDFAIQHAHVNKRPVNPKSRVPTIPPDLDKLIMAALAKDPDKRIPGCHEFLRLLGQVGTQPHTEPVRSFKIGWLISLLVIIFFFVVWLSAR